MANLYLLAVLSRLLVGAASGGAASALGAVAIPLKMLLIIALIYLVFTQAKIDAIGFCIGVTVQLVSISIETGRAARRAAAQEEA